MVGPGRNFYDPPQAALSLATPLSTTLSNQLNNVGILSQKM